MAKMYCHNCTIRLGIVRPASPINLTGTQYQLGKLLKHTAPTGCYPLNGIFDDPSYERYESYVASALSSGSALVHDDGRVSMLWAAGSQIGLRIEQGKPVVPADIVTVVLADDEYHIHAYPDASVHFGVAKCASCGVPIITSSGIGMN